MNDQIVRIVAGICVAVACAFLNRFLQKWLSPKLSGELPFWVERIKLLFLIPFLVFYFLVATAKWIHGPTATFTFLGIVIYDLIKMKKRKD